MMLCFSDSDDVVAGVDIAMNDKTAETAISKPFRAFLLMEHMEAATTELTCTELISMKHFATFNANKSLIKSEKWASLMAEMK